MTKAGTINTQPVTMFRERVRSVGISLLGGNSGVDGPYELGIEEIRAVNEEDVTVKPSKLNCCLEPVADFILYCSRSFDDAGSDMNPSTNLSDLLPCLMSSVTAHKARRC